jgi:hypothetical protein
MTPEQIAALSTADLDALIAQAAKERTRRPEAQTTEAPKEFEATLNPAWAVFLAGENTVLQFRHAGHGWVSIAIPPLERAHLASLFVHHSLIAPPARNAGQAVVVTPVPPTQGGGTMH